MALTGDWAKLSEAISQCRSAGMKIMPAATEALKRSAQAQYRADFSAQKDPWGSPWAPSPNGLDRTGALKSAQATSGRGTVRIKPVRYWVFLQIGANGMKPRGILPFSPSKWDPPMRQSVGLVVGAHFTAL